MVPVEENKNRSGQGAETGLKNAKRWKRQILIQLTWELTLWLKNFFILGTEVKEELIQLMSGKLQLRCVCLQRQTYSTIQAKGWKHSRKKLLPFHNSSGVIRTHHHPLSIKTNWVVWHVRIRWGKREEQQDAKMRQTAKLSLSPTSHKNVLKIPCFPDLYLLGRGQGTVQSVSRAAQAGEQKRCCMDIRHVPADPQVSFPIPSPISLKGRC